MIEYGMRMDNLWFAAQSANWDMVHYQIVEMKEIQEVGEITRSNFASLLKTFENNYLDALDRSATTSKDLQAFAATYDNAVSGCNSCHAAASSAAFQEPEVH
jgi:hypothetical protein